ncbi:hypothetical protein B0H14DRAFT_3662021 [Mycena olivaceomarginata]|nr:hypothetical protein B0H14DRAFT_3662021 [Mycena olivaceomarginata]
MGPLGDGADQELDQDHEHNCPFAEQMISLGGNNALRKQVCAEIQEGVRGARGDDSGSLKPVICDYVHPMGTPWPTDTLKPAARGTKADRGYHNPVTARLLTTTKHQATEETYTAIRDGTIEVLGTDFPYFMYRDGMVVDPEDLDEGLLESHVMYATAKHIYQGPSAALEAAGFTRGKAGNAALNGVLALDERDIAYVGCQVRFGLSSQATWSGHCGSFSYSDFYWAIVKALGGEEGKVILDRFNYAVFGTVASAKRSAVTAATGPSDSQRLETQRAAKRARKIAGAAATATATAPS